MRSSQAAFDLIVREEVSSEKVYRSRYQRPEWPGVQSGPTVGIGYDLGQTSAATIRADWGDRVDANTLEAMVSCAGKTGAAGRVHTAKVRNQILIPWEMALDVHKDCVVPRWEARLAKALPNTDALSGDCFGALLSLAFNRGTSFSQAGERYREMRAIKAHMAAERFSAIPAEFRSMKRIWPDVPGLQARREREAKLFERGLKQKPIPQPAPPDVEPTPDVDAPKPGLLRRFGKKIAATLGGVTGFGWLAYLTDWQIAAVAFIFIGVMSWGLIWFAVWLFGKERLRDFFHKLVRQ